MVRATILRKLTTNCLVVCLIFLVVHDETTFAKSYLDEYILPSAKSAINKIQQSFGDIIKPTKAEVPTNGLLVQNLPNLGAKQQTNSTSIDNFPTTTHSSVESTSESGIPTTKSSAPTAAFKEPPNIDFVRILGPPQIDQQQQQQTDNQIILNNQDQPSREENAFVPIATSNFQKGQNSIVKTTSNLNETSKSDLDESTQRALTNDETSVVNELASVTDSSSTLDTKTPTTTTTNGLSSFGDPALSSGSKVDEIKPTPTSSLAASESISQNELGPSPSEDGPIAVVDLTASNSITESSAIDIIAQTATNADEASTTTSATPTSIATSISSIDSTNSSPSWKDAERDAVAAVDASINFGDSPMNPLEDTCYDEYANARYCEPEFENVAFEKLIEVSSECGKPASRFCLATGYQSDQNQVSSSASKDQVRNCHICDAKHAKLRHPAAHLTDLHMLSQPTCWVSGPQMYNQSPGNSNIENNTLDYDDDDYATNQQFIRRDNVSLVLNLNKKYEISYVSMQFCSLKPDSLAIYKSDDLGKTWTPYQFYSSSCSRIYGQELNQRLVKGSGGLTANCVSLASSGSGSGGAKTNSSNLNRVFFSTMVSHNANLGASNADTLFSDWQTATNIKIVLDRPQTGDQQAARLVRSTPSNNAQNSPVIEAQQQSHSSSPGITPNQSNASSSTQANNLTSPIEQDKQQATTSTPGDLTRPSDYYNYAIADLSVGARCKCNGHASQCVLSSRSQASSPDKRMLECDCRHNTAGPECERCAPFHFDRPWSKATQLDANPCQPCNCNGHSRKCYFDAELYRLSGKRSGGVCLNCQDNTTGRHCNYCLEGFTRDQSKPLSDKEACKPCDCHPLGSLGRVCNQTTGQCPCREGVIGLQCNRCAPGYQQSNSANEPCIKLPEKESVHDVGLTVIEIPEEHESNALGVSYGNTDGAFDDQKQQHKSTVDNANEVLPPNELDLPASTTTQSRSQSGPINNANSIVDEQIFIRNPTNRNGADPNYNHFVDQDDENFSGPVQEAAQQRNGARAGGYENAGSGGKRWNHHTNYLANRHYSYAGAWPPGDQPPRIQQHYLHHHRQATAAAVASEQPNSMNPPKGQLGHAQEPTDYQDYPSQINNKNDHYYSQSYPHSSAYANGPEYAISYSSRRFSAGPAGSMAKHPSRAHSLNRARYPDQIRPVANLEPDQSIDHPPLILDQDLATNELDSDDLNFNRIETNSNRRPPMNMKPVPMSQSSSNAANMRAQFSGPSLDAANSGQLESQPTGNELPTQHQAASSCGECRESSRRGITRAQFCHLDYALKVTIRSKLMSDDWTRFEAKVIDVFKAPSSLINSNNNILSLGQNSNKTIGDTVNGKFLQHRLKLNSIHWIWVPTEDLNCKCLRLRSGSSYLIMGSIDSRDDVIQLDRHGLALEWQGSFQDRLRKHQRRLARGKCSSNSSWHAA